MVVIYAAEVLQFDHRQLDWLLVGIQVHLLHRHCCLCFQLCHQHHHHHHHHLYHHFVLLLHPGLHFLLQFHQLLPKIRNEKICVKLLNVFISLINRNSYLIWFWMILNNFSAIIVTFINCSDILSLARQ